MAAAKRFAQTTFGEIEAKRVKVNADHTIKSNEKSARILKDYLKEIRMNTAFEVFDDVKLAEVLSHFYMDIRKADGTKYKSSSLDNIRHGLNRYLRTPPYNCKYDIIKDSAFTDANMNFKAMMAELKREGLGTVNHYPVINEVDREKMYTSLHLKPTTPSGLYNKVHFDIRLYFFRRGAENMHLMKKNTFSVKTDPKTGLKFVTKQMDEMTKNHRANDKENVSGIMPETPGSTLCPVASYELYVSKLHPENDRLWQRSVASFVEDQQIWYCNAPVGEKKMATFMSDLSKVCELSQIYTNHSIRATGSTILSKGMYSPAQIMSVTGHKSVQSLTVYQRVDDEEKIRMGQTITQSMQPAQSKQLALPAPNNQPHVACQSKPPIGYVTPLATAPLQNHEQSNIVPFIYGVTLSDIFSDFSDISSVSNSVSNTQSNPNTYNNCHITVIQNLTINK